MNIQEKLMTIQQELKAPKNQFNKFGKYNYRSLEDIMEGVKPLLAKTKTTLVLSDKVQSKGDRVYIEVEAVLSDTESNGDSFIKATACAREALTQKGMQDSQLTGSTSSYARKYCLNGLFCIDDTKDADTQEPPKAKTQPKLSPYLQKMKGYAENEPDIYKAVLAENGIKSAVELKTKAEQDEMLVLLAEKLKG